MERKTSIAREGQRFVDEPVFVTHMPKPVSVLTESIAHAFRSPLPRPIRELSHYNRVPLRWHKPDGKRGFKPKGAR